MSDGKTIAEMTHQLQCSYSQVQFCVSLLLAEGKLLRKGTRYYANTPQR